MTQEIGIREVLQQVDARMGSLEGRLDRLELEMAHSFRFTWGLIFFIFWAALIATIIGLGLAILSRL